MAEGAAVPRNDVFEKVEWKVEECVFNRWKRFFQWDERVMQLRGQQNVALQ